MNLLGRPARVGHHCGSHEHRVSREVVDFYADALDDHHPLYQHFAPPLLYHSECCRFLGEWYLKNLFGNLHARQEWELFSPMPLGARVRSRSTIVQRYHKRGRDYVVNETDITAVQDGRLLVRGRTHQSFLPQGQGPEGGGFVVDAETSRRKRETRPQPTFPVATGPDLPSLEKRVDARRCWMFSGPGRNYHTDRAEAQKLGFPDIVVQGMMTTCFVAQEMLERFGEGFLAGGRMSLKLIDVVWVDEVLQVRGRIRRCEPEGLQTRVHCDVWVEKEDGSRVLIGEASALE